MQICNTSCVGEKLEPISHSRAAAVWSRDSSVGIGTRYGLEGSGSNPGGARFSAAVQTGPGAHPASYAMGTGFVAGVKRPGRSVDQPPHLAPRLKKE
jgi:hypothetical protein